MFRASRRRRRRSARRCSSIAASRDHRQQRQVRHDVREDLGVLDLTGHHRLGDARRLQHRDALAQLPERDPVQRRPGWRAAAPRGRDASSLIATTVTSWPERARGVEHEERKPAVAGDQPDSRHRGGRRYSSATLLVGDHFFDARRGRAAGSTPRCELRMNSTRYRTSGQVSVRSCSICASAGVVFSFDTEQVAVGPLQLAR